MVPYSIGGWECCQVEESRLPFQWGCNLSRYSQVSTVKLWIKQHINNLKKNQLSFSLNKVLSLSQDIWEQRLPLEPSGGVSQPVPVHLWAAPECPIGVHWPLRAASSLHTGWWERHGLQVTPNHCFQLLWSPVSDYKKSDRWSGG